MTFRTALGLGVNNSTDGTGSRNISQKGSRDGNSTQPILIASNIPAAFQPLIITDDSDTDVI